MSDATHDYVRLAEDDGAHFCQIRTTGLWGVSDKHGMVIVPYVDGAMSREEAARLYCEEKGLAARTPETILARIVREYRPYDTLPAFGEGFTAHSMRQFHNPYPSSVAAQAWDRGYDAAALYQRALAFLDAPPKDVEKVQPNWLAKLLMGRC
jgi:hypothetical protein